MGKFFGIIKASIKNSIAYRFEMAISLITDPLSIVVQYFLWKTIFAYSGQAQIGGFAFEELMIYFIINLAVLTFIWTDVADVISWDIRKGSIAKELLKPIDYLIFNFFIAVGNRLFSIIIEIIPILIIGFLFFGTKLLPVNFVLFLISLSLALIINFLMSAAVGMSAFWFVQNRGILKLKRLTATFLSGALIPITFFPLWFQGLSKYLPFQYMNYVPINFWLGKYQLLEGAKVIGFQIAWIFIIYIILIIIWRKATGRVASVGI